MPKARPAANEYDSLSVQYSISGPGGRPKNPMLWRKPRLGEFGYVFSNCDFYVSNQAVKNIKTQLFS